MEIFESFVEKAVVVARFSKVPEVLNDGQDLSFQVTDNYPLPLQNPSSLIDRSEHRQPTVSTAPGRDPSVVEACSQSLQGGCQRAQRVHVDCEREQEDVSSKLKNAKKQNTHAVVVETRTQLVVETRTQLLVVEKSRCRTRSPQVQVKQ